MAKRPYGSPTGRKPSEPMIQNIRPPQTAETQKIIDELRAAMLKNMGIN